MIVVLGAFDGFHRGHALLLERARDLAFSLGNGWGVVAFDPHPGLFLGTVNETLFTPGEWELSRLFLGVPHVARLRFDETLTRLSPRLFWNFLRESVEIDGVVVGEDFRFGFRREGDAALLESFCRENSLPFLSVDLLRHFGQKISSSSIRAHAAAGRCERAAEELGYPYFVWSEVVHGLARGRTLGVPTANLDAPRMREQRKLLPAEGVYAVAVLAEGRLRPGALSIGMNPTFEDVPDIRAEVFILDYEPDREGSLYGKKTLVFFLSRLRPQRRFENAALLVRQIEADIVAARSAFGRKIGVFDWRAGFLRALEWDSQGPAALGPPEGVLSDDGENFPAKPE
jgi:riboflavin kinase/FMN adenylyltransferase